MTGRHPASFRDPSGYLFRHQDKIHRHVTPEYREHYDRMLSSGFYEAVRSDGSFISHEEVSPGMVPGHESAYKILLPMQLPFVSHPYEWSFSQLRDAALLTLRLQKKALAYGLSLKDASAYNVQYFGGRPVFIDTLSLEQYKEGRPWVAYKQFCSHFLAPLALMSYCHPHLAKLLQVSIDGIPLELASRILPTRTRLRLGLLLHLHIHARYQRAHGDRRASAESANTGRLPKSGLLGVIKSLEGIVRRLHWKPVDTEWADYYEDTNYSSTADEHKARVVEEFLDALRPNSLWDLGANTGRFSRLASRRGVFTVAFDVDPAAVEKNYLQARENNESSILPLVLDLTNPTPGVGWASEERASLADRGPADVAMALALIHHLAISNNVPLRRIASYFRSLSRALIIEFVPKTDSQVVRLFRTREDIFPDYTREGFEVAFGEHFEIRRRVELSDSQRTLYWLRAHR